MRDNRRVYRTIGQAIMQIFRSEPKGNVLLTLFEYYQYMEARVFARKKCRPT